MTNKMLLYYYIYYQQCQELPQTISRKTESSKAQANPKNKHMSRRKAKLKPSLKAEHPKKSTKSRESKNKKKKKLNKSKDSAQPTSTLMPKPKEMSPTDSKIKTTLESYYSYPATNMPISILS